MPATEHTSGPAVAAPESQKAARARTALSRLLRPGLLAALLLPALHAYPPMPDHILYGQVRDELGNPLQIETGVVRLETSAGTSLATRIVPGLEPGVNYRLPVPLDAGLTLDLYRPTALRPTVPFKLRVQIGTTVYLPMEMQGDCARLGAPAQRTRLDLTLGEDSDGDGLPDAWERRLISASGRPWTLADIRPEDDFDQDGLSNLAEYTAGTYAFDAQDGFRLEWVAEGAESVLAFLAIPGRTYTLQASMDVETWEPVPFRLISPRPEEGFRQTYYAVDVCVLRIAPVPAGEVKRFFRLMVN